MSGCWNSAVVGSCLRFLPFPVSCFVAAAGANGPDKAAAAVSTSWRASGPGEPPQEEAAWERAYGLMDAECGVEDRRMRLLEMPSDEGGVSGRDE